ncbi:NucA/NucB deoxyribonuclease domain-containing protein [Krasilnikovia cinnamomea]|uniref:NucA/NucB deoxyribonuclease domain-containing protein n=1 Tax=Krasilnikovia cinnamomea TaxID=349313 RepID=UPI00102BA33B|nr:hypothetical protein [Krasilnikovia cinnamomea]
MFRRIPVVAAVTVAVLVTSGLPASAAPPALPAGELAWQVTSTTPPPVPAPSASRRGGDPKLRVRAHGQSAVQHRAAEDDFKTACLNNTASRDPGGWARSRYEQCFIGHRDVELLERRSDGTIVRVAKIMFNYSLLAFPVDGERRVDYLFDFDEFTTEGGEPLPETTLTVEFTGCSTLVTCSSTPTQRAELVPVWKTGNRRYEFHITSPNDTGVGTFSIVRGLMTMNMSVVSAAPNIVPWLESGMAASRTRFDSAKAKLGQGKYHGAVFSDFIPTLDLDTRAGVDYAEEARHVEDALHNPARTFPSIANKSVPGEAGRGRPLHRLMSEVLPDKNNAASRSICIDVWGEEYTSNGTKQCDEYPFKSTYEGSAVSTGATEQNPNGGNPWRWQGSARPIGKDANEKGGGHLGLFYGQNRILDENMGTDRQGTPSDPYYVRIIS